MVERTAKKYSKEEESVMTEENVLINDGEKQ